MAETWERLVESVLLGLASSRDSAISEIVFLDSRKERLVIRSTAVEHFHATDFLANNIVDRVAILDDKSPEDDLVEDLWTLIYGDHAVRTDPGHQMGVRNALSSIRSGSLTLLRVEPVYGAFVLVLAGQHRLQREGLLLA